MSRLKNFFISILMVMLLSSVAFAASVTNICEEDAAKIAMSHYIKNFSSMLADPNAKVIVENVSTTKISGINGTIDMYRVKLSKYNKNPFLKISDFFMYEIDAVTGIIVGIKNLENVDGVMKLSAFNAINDPSLFSGPVDYEKFAAILCVYGEDILEILRTKGDESSAFKNIDTIIAGISTYKPGLLSTIEKFVSGYKTIRLIK
ncbi:MAG TPA: hypothetical protein PKK26_06800 [Candidatus Wallbacteria bacterium]|nr:hypothetical protein [Candidatus Wallbacteria bacterium]